MLATIAATHSSQLWKVPLVVAPEELMPEKIGLLLSALTLLQHDPEIEQVIRGLQQNKMEAESGGSAF